MIFYVKKSYGKNYKIINIYKIKTLKKEFENVIPENKKNFYGKYYNDNRTNKFNNFLRKYWIDELPQIINLIKGDIKLIGIRPIHIKNKEYPKYLQDKILQIKPGLISINYCFNKKHKNFEDSFKYIILYLNQYHKNPIKTDFEYLLKFLKNIIHNHIL